MYTKGPAENCMDEMKRGFQYFRKQLSDKDKDQTCFFSFSDEK
jgi:hypothetical protein